MHINEKYSGHFGKKAGKIQRHPEALISIMLICLIKVEDLKILKCLKLHFNMEEVFLFSHFSYSVLKPI